MCDPCFHCDVGRDTSAYIRLQSTSKALTISVPITAITGTFALLVYRLLERTNNINSLENCGVLLKPELDLIGIGRLSLNSYSSPYLRAVQVVIRSSRPMQQFWTKVLAKVG
jgi:hypothetical protein